MARQEQHPLGGSHDGRGRGHGSGRLVHASRNGRNEAAVGRDINGSVDFEPDEEQRLIVETARAFADRELAPRAGERDRASDVPRARDARARRAGPARHDGPGGLRRRRGGPDRAGAGAARDRARRRLGRGHHVGHQHGRRDAGPLRDRGGAPALPAAAVLGRGGRRRVRAVRAAGRQRPGGDDHHGRARRRRRRLPHPRQQAVDHLGRPRRRACWWPRATARRWAAPGYSTFVVEQGTPGLDPGPA